MTLSRKLVVMVVIALATTAVAISFSGVASASPASIPTAVLSVSAHPGHLAVVTRGTSCGGFITVDAIGHGGGSGRAMCGQTVLSVPASPLGTFDDTSAPFAAATFACQANALHASQPVTVVCTENVD
jgi:hypothetical protein